MKYAYAIDDREFRLIFYNYTPEESGNLVVQVDKFRERSDVQDVGLTIPYEEELIITFTGDPSCLNEYAAFLMGDPLQLDTTG